MMLIDTSGFFAVYSEKDKNHVPAKAQIKYGLNGE